MGVSASQLPSTSGEWSSVIMNSKFGRVSAPMAELMQNTAAIAVKMELNFMTLAF
jgi:hypothetical protein